MIHVRYKGGGTLVVNIGPQNLSQTTFVFKVFN